ncbi:MAG: murein biosynthesis integral membrane protein MurJ [Nitriliruptor sp.]|uniref:murein biosynthesis integral membrane protein MurJ n=1 Tax=Nitriliruptor sp. TaxID=2448056 RepID=UPI0034A06E21
MTDPAQPTSGGSSLRRSSTLVAAGILLSRISGLLREAVMARLLGVGVGTDAFRAALRIPNVLQNLLGEGVLSASFIPVYSGMLARGREEDAGRLAGAIAGLLIAVTTVIVLIGVVFAGPLVRVIAFGFEPGSERYELTVSLVRIITPGVGFLVLSAWCLGILNSHRRFFLSYVAPVVWNTAIITAMVATYLVTAEEVALATALGWGALVGSVLQFLVQVGPVLRRSPGLRLSLSRSVPGVDEVIRRFGAVVAGRGGVQLAGYVDLFVASLLAGGAVAALGFAQVLYLLPISLFGMSVAAAELPELSTMDHGDRDSVVTRLEGGLGRVAFFVVPSSVAFLLLGDQVVALIYSGGRFTDDTAVQVGTILAAYSLGMLASTSSRLLQSALYGVGDARSPAIYGVLRVILSTLVGVAIMFPLDAVQATSAGFEVVGRVAGQTAEGGNLLRLGAAGLALGAAVGAWFELTLLRIRVGIVFGRPRLGGPHLRSLLVAAGAAAVAALGARTLIAELELPMRVEAVLALGLVGSVYLAVTLAAGVPEARELLDSAKRRSAG